MTTADQPDPTPELVESRIAIAQADLQQAEALDLGTASNATLITTVETLRMSLFDMIQLVRQTLRG